MPGSDRPDSLKRAFHELVVQLREARGWTQAGLVERIVALIVAGFSFHEQVDVGWLRQIEEGTRSRISRALVDLLARALECNAVQRRALELAAFQTLVFGEQVARLRNNRKPKPLSRAQLVRRLDRLDPDGTLAGEKISEGWLRQIEEGRKVKISRAVVDLLVRALGCSDFEEFQLLLAAGKNPLTDAEGNLSKETEHHSAMLFLMRKHPRGPALFQNMVMSNPERFFNLTPHEMFDLFEKGLALLKLNDDAENDSAKEGDTEK